MFVNFSEIFKAQKALDREIQNKHQTNYQMNKDNLKLALLVELGELANEIRSFKFWSLKPASTKEVILEEYVDVIHFITSICIFLKSKETFKIKNINQKNSKNEITKTFNYLFDKSKKILSKSSAHKWYTHFLNFGIQLGFNIEDIKKAYWSKNEINYQRQQTNY